jgi:hypothetical protein
MAFCGCKAVKCCTGNVFTAENLINPYELQTYSSFNLACHLRPRPNVISLLIMTLLIMTLLIMTLLTMTLLIMTLLIMTLLIITLLIITLLVMTCLIMTTYNGFYL